MGVSARHGCSLSDLKESTSALCFHGPLSGPSVPAPRVLTPDGPASWALVIPPGLTLGQLHSELAHPLLVASLLFHCLCLSLFPVFKVLQSLLLTLDPGQQ